MITNYRKTYGGSGLGGYTTIELLEDGQWVHGATFTQDDDYMSKHLNDYICNVQRRISMDAPRKWVIRNKVGLWNGIDLLKESFHIETRDKDYAMSFVYVKSPYDVYSTAI